MKFHESGDHIDFMRNEICVQNQIASNDTQHYQILCGTKFYTTLKTMLRINEVINCKGGCLIINMYVVQMWGEGRCPYISQLIKQLQTLIYV